jgi:ribosomal protein S27AE
MSERCKHCGEGVILYYWDEQARLRLICRRCRIIMNASYEIVARPPVAAQGKAEGK